MATNVYRAEETVYYDPDEPFRSQGYHISTSTDCVTHTVEDNVSMKNIKDKLERLLDDFRDWKNIYGSQVPAGYAEPKDRAKERKKFIADIAKLREQLKSSSVPWRV